jgi:hypothetical protein
MSDDVEVLRSKAAKLLKLPDTAGKTGNPAESVVLSIKTARKKGKKPSKPAKQKLLPDDKESYQFDKISASQSIESGCDGIASLKQVQGRLLRSQMTALIMKESDEELEREIRHNIHTLMDLAELTTNETISFKVNFKAESESDKLYAGEFISEKEKIANIYGLLCTKLKTREVDQLENHFAQLGEVKQKLDCLQILDKNKNEPDPILSEVKSGILNMINGLGDKEQIADSLQKAKAFIDELDNQNRTEFRKIKRPSAMEKDINKKFSSYIRKYKEGIKLLTKRSDPANPSISAEGLLLLKRAVLNIEKALGES